MRHGSFRATVAPMIDMDDRELSKKMNVGFGSRLMAFLASWVLMAVVSMVVSWFLTRSGLTTPRLRIATVIQDVVMFVLPPLIAAMISCRLPARLLLLNRPGSPLPYILAILATVAVIPAMNCLVAWNEGLSLPAAMSGIEQWMRDSEASARQNLEVLMGPATVGSLVADLLIVALLAGFSEELFFRGGLQRLLSTRPMNPHIAIWIAAVVFSAVHVQFYGFFPRLLLGAWFGYLAWWSGTIWLPVAAHVANNAIVVISGWALRRGSMSLDLDSLGSRPGSDLPMILGSIVLTALVILLIYKHYHINEDKNIGM